MSRKLKKRVPVPSFAFVVDGETEIWYLEMLKRNERGINLRIKPEIPQKKGLDDQFELVCNLASSEYDRVYWIVDLDTIIKESNEAPTGVKTPLTSFFEMKTYLSDKLQNVQVIVNNPCLEFWFLLHLKRTSRYKNIKILPEMFRCNQGIKEVAQGVRENGEIFHKER